MRRYQASKLTLCEDFINQAKETWHRLHQSEVSGLSLSEESITDHNLLDIWSKHQNEIQTQKFTHYQESRVGADWEWWFVSGRQALGLRIQAKKLTSSNLTYSELDKMKTPGKRQIDVLITHANASRPPMIPFYVFYNYWDTSKFIPSWLCGSYAPCFEMLGCSISYAGIVRQILGSGTNSLISVSDHMYPWSCLVCCRGYSNNKILPIRVYEYITQAFMSPDFEDFTRERYITTEAPDYVYRIAEGLLIEEQEWETIPVSRVTVISNLLAPVRTVLNIPLK